MHKDIKNSQFGGIKYLLFQNSGPKARSLCLHVDELWPFIDIVDSFICTWTTYCTTDWLWTCHMTEHIIIKEEGFLEVNNV